MLMYVQSMEGTKPEKVVILLDDSEDEAAKICGIDETKNKNCSEEQENGDRKEMKKHRTRAEEYKLLADLTNYPNLAALLAFEVPIRERRRERNRRRRERRRLRKEIEAQKEKLVVVVNGQEKHEKVVILLDDSEDEGVKNGQGCVIDERKKRKCSEEEENGDNKESHAYRIRVEEYKMLADLTDYPHLAAMLAFEAPMRKRRRERNKKRRERKKPRKEMEAQKANGAEKKNDKNKNVDKAMPVNAENEVKSSMVIDICSSSSETEEAIAEAGSFEGLQERAPTEETARKQEKWLELQDDSTFTVKDGEQPDKVEIVAISKALETETIPITENIVPDNRFANVAENKNQDNTKKDTDKAMPFNARNDVKSSTVKDIYASFSESEEAIAEAGSFKGLQERAPTEVIARIEEKGLELLEDNIFSEKEGEQPDTVEIVAISKALETETIPVTENIVPEKLIIFSEKEREQPHAVEIVAISKALETERIPVTENIVLEKLIIFPENEGEQPDTVEIVAISKALETETIPVTENIVSEKLIVKIAEEEKQADLSKDAETTISLETVSVEQTDNIMVEIEEEERQADLSKDAETTMSLETVSAERTDNIVLRKLLRGPRYFDHPASSWGTSSNCGEDDRITVNRVLKKQMKPCYICGSLEHKAKRCKQRKNCSTCSRRGHLAKDCKEKHTDNKSSKICLKCGDSEHDMFSCSSAYSPDDLKEIQCYVCKSSAHLCCVDFLDEGPRKVSCYSCGQPGHLGSECSKLRRKTPAFSICFNCGEEGHFARECPKHAKFHLEQISTCSLNSSGITELPSLEVEPAKGDLATHERSLEKKKNDSGVKLAPHEFNKGLKSEKQSKKRVNMTENQGRWNGSSPTVHPQNQIYAKPRANVWLSPAAVAAAKVSSEMAARNGAQQHMHPTNQVPAFRGAQHMHPTNQVPAFRGAQHMLPTNQVPAFHGAQYTHPKYPCSISSEVVAFNGTRISSEVVPFNGARYPHPAYPRGIFNYHDNGPNRTSSSKAHQYNGQY